MRNHMIKRIICTGITVLAFGCFLSGCSQNDTSETESDGSDVTVSSDTGDSVSAEDGESQAIQAGSDISELEVRFGDDGEPFLMQLEDNDTARAIAGYVGTSDWRLPVYETDDDADYSVLQYYDIPSRYEIPSEPQTVTSAQAGEVFYSEPNRIVLYYQDTADISEEYTKVGTFDPTEEFVTAVEENPVIEGWGNKIVQINEP